MVDNKEFQKTIDKFQEFVVNSAEWRGESQAILSFYGKAIEELQKEHNKLEENLCNQIESLNKKLDGINEIINQKILHLYWKVGGLTATVAILVTFFLNSVT